MAKIPVALQMYTLREAMQQDFEGTIRRVAALGYAGVELAGYGGLSGRELHALLESVNLRVAGDHVALSRLEQDLDGVIALAKELGNTYVVCPAVPQDRRNSAEAWKALAGVFDHVGRQCASNGLQFCYHNHAFEFEPIGNSNGFDILYGSTDPANVKMELDMFWAVKGGREPATILNHYTGRVPLIHLKDMTKDAAQTFAEVGEGSLDFQSIFNLAHTAGIRWYIVEQDRCQGDPFESVATSLKHLRTWGIA